MSVENLGRGILIIVIISVIIALVGTCVEQERIKLYQKIRMQIDSVE